MKLVANLRPLASRYWLPSALCLLSPLVTGCGIGNVVAPNSTDTTIAGFHGVIHGGPNPVGNARVVLYNTTSGGYGVGNALQTVTADANGNFAFNGNTCPAGQYAYIVAYGGNTGGNTNNPNSLLMAALGPCSSLYTGTTYTGQTVLMNELTTIAAGYALSNFITISGTAVAGTGSTAGNSYIVGIGSSATNNGTAGCVSNGYYGTSTCPTTVAAGLRHAFANAAALVSPFSGQPTTTTANGASVPFQELNTLGNVLQSCVNSSGGGTNASGLPTATITATGTTFTGTSNCAKLFAYTTYSSNGTNTGTITSAGNTLQAVVNLAKRPSGTATSFDAGCTSGGTGSTPAATCIYNLASSTGFYQTSMSAAPPDWMMAISYPKGSFSGGATATTGCNGSPTGTGVLYPFMVATDINDNVVILNGDQSTATCYNLVTVGYDGLLKASNDFDTTSATPIWVSTDAFGHAIVPVHATENGIRVYGMTDAGVPLDANIAGVANTGTNLPYYTAVDQYDGIYVTSQGGPTSPGTNFGYLSVSGTENHLMPTYNTVLSLGSASTSKLNMVTVDVNGNAITTTSNSSGSGNTRLAAAVSGPGATTGGTVTSQGSLTGSTSNGETTAADSTGAAVWNIQTPATGATSTTYTAATGGISLNLVVNKQTYTAGAGVTPVVTAATQTAITPGEYKPSPGQIDGNNVIWVADLQGCLTANTTSPCAALAAGTVYYTYSVNNGVSSSSIHGYDTVNNFGTAAYQGCKFTTPASTACGSQSTDATYPSNTPYVLYATRGLAIDASGDIWLANGAQGQINEIIGLGAPTWPLFIHNGSSNKP